MTKRGLNALKFPSAGPGVRGGGPAVQRGPEAHGAVAEPGPAGGSAARAAVGGGDVQVAAVQPGGEGIVGLDHAVQALHLLRLLRTEQLLQEGLY